MLQIFLILKISEAHIETLANFYIKNDNFFITFSKEDRSINLEGRKYK